MALKRYAVLTLAAFAIACGGGGTAPGTRSSGLRILAGNNQTDTIGASLNQALVILVEPLNGQPASHELVRFQVLQDTVTYYYPIAVMPLAYGYATTAIYQDSTDADGQTSVGILFGLIAERESVVISVPSRGFVDTARFTITPGHKVKITGLPTDTTVYNNVTVTLGAKTVDRGGNPTQDTVHYALVAGPATVSGAQLTTTDFGIAHVAATSGALADTGAYTVVPHGRLAATDGYNLYVFNLDQTDSGHVGTPQWVGNVRWAPNGQSLIFDETIGGCEIGDSSPWATTTLSGTTTVLPMPGGSAWSQYPVFTRDGKTIYVSLSNYGAEGQLWRGNSDFSSPAQVTLNPPDPAYGASPSPDGTQLAYFAALTSKTVLRVLTVGTGTVTDLGLTAFVPQWSPVSDSIAYIASSNCTGPIHLVSATGAGDRVLTTDSYVGAFDWSPDGKWIAALNATTSLIDLINVASGQVLPLPFTRGWLSPTWLPTVSTSGQRVTPRVTLAGRRPAPRARPAGRKPR